MSSPVQRRAALDSLVQDIEMSSSSDDNRSDASSDDSGFQDAQDNDMGRQQDRAEERHLQMLLGADGGNSSATTVGSSGQANPLVDRASFGKVPLTSAHLAKNRDEDPAALVQEAMQRRTPPPDATQSTEGGSVAKPPPKKRMTLADRMKAMEQPKDEGTPQTSNVGDESDEKRTAAALKQTDDNVTPAKAPASPAKRPPTKSGASAPNLSVGPKKGPPGKMKPPQQGHEAVQQPSTPTTFASPKKPPPKTKPFATARQDGSDTMSPRKPPSKKSSPPPEAPRDAVATPTPQPSSAEVPHQESKPANQQTSDATPSQAPKSVPMMEPLEDDENTSSSHPLESKNNAPLKVHPPYSQEVPKDTQSSRSEPTTVSESQPTNNNGKRSTPTAVDMRSPIRRPVPMTSYDTAESTASTHVEPSSNPTPPSQKQESVKKPEGEPSLSQPSDSKNVRRVPKPKRTTVTSVETASSPIKQASTTKPTSKVTSEERETKATELPTLPPLAKPVVASTATGTTPPRRPVVTSTATETAPKPVVHSTATATTPPRRPLLATTSTETQPPPNPTVVDSATSTATIGCHSIGLMTDEAAAPAPPPPPAVPVKVAVHCGIQTDPPPQSDCGCQIGYPFGGGQMAANDIQTQTEVSEFELSERLMRMNPRASRAAPMITAKLSPTSDRQRRIVEADAYNANAVVHDAVDATAAANQYDDRWTVEAFQPEKRSTPKQDHYQRREEKQQQQRGVDVEVSPPSAVVSPSRLQRDWVEPDTAGHEDPFFNGRHKRQTGDNNDPDTSPPRSEQPLLHHIHQQKQEELEERRQDPMGTMARGEDQEVRSEPLPLEQLRARFLKQQQEAEAAAASKRSPLSIHRQQSSSPPRRQPSPGPKMPKSVAMTIPVGGKKPALRSTKTEGVVRKSSPTSSTILQDRPSWSPEVSERGLHGKKTSPKRASPAMANHRRGSSPPKEPVHKVAGGRQRSVERKPLSSTTILEDRHHQRSARESPKKQHSEAIAKVYSIADEERAAMEEHRAQRMRWLMQQSLQHKMVEDMNVEEEEIDDRNNHGAADDGVSGRHFHTVVPSATTTTGSVVEYEDHRLGRRQSPGVGQRSQKMVPSSPSATTRRPTVMTEKGGVPVKMTRGMPTTANGRITPKRMSSPSIVGGKDVPRAHSTTTPRGRSAYQTTQQQKQEAQARKDKVRLAKEAYSKAQRQKARGWQADHDDQTRGELVEQFKEYTQHSYPQTADDDDGSYEVGYGMVHARGGRGAPPMSYHHQQHDVDKSMSSLHSGNYRGDGAAKSQKETAQRMVNMISAFQMQVHDMQ